MLRFDVITLHISFIFVVIFVVILADQVLVLHLVIANVKVFFHNFEFDLTADCQRINVLRKVNRFSDPNGTLAVDTRHMLVIKLVLKHQFDGSNVETLVASSQCISESCSHLLEGTFLSLLVVALAFQVVFCLGDSFSDNMNVEFEWSRDIHHLEECVVIHHKVVLFYSFVVHEVS